MGTAVRAAYKKIQPLYSVTTGVEKIQAHAKLL